MINEAVYTLFDDMRKQPHLMIAGESGSGKSVVINGIITTLLHYDSWQMQMILIDPKRVELSIYKNTPHCIRYASEPDTMVNALRYAMQICADSGLPSSVLPGMSYQTQVSPAMRFAAKNMGSSTR